MAGERVVKIGNRLFALPPVAQQQATIGAPPAQPLVTDPGEPLGARRVEELVRQAITAVRDRVAPISGNVPPSQSVPLPGGRALNLPAVGELATDIAQPGIGALGKAGLGTLAFMLREAAEQAAKRSVSGAKRLPEAALDLVRRQAGGAEGGARRVLFHSGTRENAVSISENGLEPKTGDWVREVLEGATDSEELIEEIASRPGVAFLSEKPEWITAQVSRKLGKSVRDVTEADIREHGHLAIFKLDPEYDADDVLQLVDADQEVFRNLAGDEYTRFHNTPFYEEPDVFSGQGGMPETPFGVESGDFFTRSELTPEYTLTGDDLVEFLRRSEAPLPARISPDLPQQAAARGAVRKVPEVTGEAAGRRVELVEIKALKRFRTEDRRVSFKNKEALDVPTEVQLQRLRDEFSSGAPIKGPVRLSVASDGTAWISDGNTRLAVLEDLGFTHVPVVVSREKGGFFTQTVPNPLTGKAYSSPENLFPSDLGFPVTSRSAKKATGDVRIISNKDGTVASRGSSFASPSANTYRVEDGGVVTGSIELVPNYPLKKINENFSGTGDAWVGFDAEGRILFANQKLSEVRKFFKSSRPAKKGTETGEKLHAKILREDVKKEFKP